MDYSEERSDEESGIAGRARSLAPLGMTKVLRWDDSKAKAQKELK
jgi:hypothetical protein